MGQPALADLERAASVLRRASDYKRTHKREFPRKWYPWQEQFFAASKDHRECLVLAGNRSGKTDSATYAHALHITGDYPEGWQGRVHRFPGRYWCLGVDAKQLRDVLQLALFGEMQEDGTFSGGWIHPSEIVSVDRSQVPKLASEVTVKHKSGGNSTVSLRSYTQSGTGQGTLPFAGSAVDGILVDEQPPDPIVGQLVVRTMTGNRGQGGYILYSMTPELGLTGLVQQFMESRGPHQALIGPISWDDCPHLTPEIREQILASIPEHERDMRSKGLPMFGSGLVFTVPESRLRVEPFSLEDRGWYTCLRAIDIGIDHPTAVAWLAYDPESDVIYLTRTYRRSGDVPAIHAAVANSQWPDVPMVFPHDADNREKGSGKTIKKLYEESGITATLDFSNPDGSLYVEPGILELQQRMQTDRFKVFAGCDEFFDEYRKYHRKNGQLVKLDDDVLSATRYGALMIRQHGVKLASQKMEFYQYSGGFTF